MIDNGSSVDRDGEERQGRCGSGRGVSAFRFDPGFGEGGIPSGGLGAELGPSVSNCRNEDTAILGRTETSRVNQRWQNAGVYFWTEVCQGQPLT